MTRDPPLPLQQHPFYAATLQHLGRRAEVTPAGPARMLVQRRGPVTLTIRGPVWPAGLPDDEKSQILRAHGPRLIEAQAGDAPHLARAGYLRLMTPGHMAELDLTGGAPAIWDRAQGKWRNRARKGRKSALRVRAEGFTGSPDHWLLSAEAAQRTERGYRGLPVAFAAAWARANPGSARLFVMEDGVQPVAGMLFLRHGTSATYFTGWTGPEGRAVSAHHALLMQAAAYFAGHGVAVIDLGSVDTEAAPGLARFKLGSGARLVALGGSWLRWRP
jgi:hypothetical protein